jgi:hypothetical protein
MLLFTIPHVVRGDSYRLRQGHRSSRAHREKAETWAHLVLPEVDLRFGCSMSRSLGFIDTNVAILSGEFRSTETVSTSRPAIAAIAASSFE